MKMLILAAAVVSGCINNGNVATDNTDPQAQGGSVRYLCVGMENSARFGACPGCKRDATRLSELMSGKFSYQGDTLISDRATKSAVVSKLKTGIESTDENGLFLFFYSGHGGQEYLGGKEPDGADRQDEFLCLYDTYMLDDEIWEIVSKCKGRVFMYFDACHSATMYRSVASELRLTEKEKKFRGAKAMDASLAEAPGNVEKTKGFTFSPDKLVKAAPMSVEGDAPRAQVRMLCWSGCKEAEYSYGGSNGGVLTSAVVNSWKNGVSYSSLWKTARSLVVKSQPGQNPVQTQVGEGFKDDMEAFK